MRSLILLLTIAFFSSAHSAFAQTEPPVVPGARVRGTRPPETSSTPRTAAFEAMFSRALSSRQKQKLPSLSFLTPNGRAACPMAAISPP